MTVQKLLSAQAKETTFDYTPLIPEDQPATFDARPRTTIVRTLGVETQRTYNAYYTDSSTGEFVEIEERTTVQGAAFGDSSNLRTTMRYFPSDADPVALGRLKSMTTPDGVMEQYTYSEDEDSNLVETVDRLAASGPVANQSTREVIVRSAQGTVIRRESYVHDGMDWALLSTVEQDFSKEVSKDGLHLTQVRKDGRIVLDQSWEGPLLVSTTNESGIERLLAYDELDRQIMEIKFGIDGSEDIVTAFDRTLGALDCGCDGEQVVTREADGLSLRRGDGTRRRGQSKNS